MIYVMSPGGYRTGGVELLHQFAHELNKYMETRLFYIGGGPVPEYSRYQIESVNELPDGDDYVVVPEIYAHRDIGSHRRIVFWESVDNYYLRYNSLKFDDDVIHLAQSEYARKHLAGMRRVIMVSDYINEDFFEDYPDLSRARLVLYNPAKGLEYTKRVMAACEGVRFMPLSGMTRDELFAIMHASRLYIDLGNHPGKDRMPREAAICGCCVITSRNGSAAYHEDVPIPEQYKINREDVPRIKEKIQDVLMNYPDRRKDFDQYRQAIREEKKRFEDGVRELADEIQRNNSGI